jgi:hypothetical protein
MNSPPPSPSSDNTKSIMTGVIVILSLLGAIALILLLAGFRFVMTNVSYGGGRGISKLFKGFV